MKDAVTRLLVASIAGLALAATVAAQDRPTGRERRGTDAPASQRSQPRGPQGEFRTDVPDHPLDVILGRPTATSVTLSVLCYADAKAYVAHGTAKEALNLRTDAQELKKGVPKEILLEKLKPDTQYSKVGASDIYGKILTRLFSCGRCRERRQHL